MKVADGERPKRGDRHGQDALREPFRLLAALPAVRGFASAPDAPARMQLTRRVRDAGLDGRTSFG